MAAERGVVLEHALRRRKLEQKESAWGLRRGEQGGWEMVELTAAAAVVNPRVRKLAAGLEEHGIRIEWVQNALRNAVDNGGLSVDMVLSKVNGGVGQYSRRDYWWVEVKWTDGDHEDRALEVVKEAWRKVQEFERVLRDIDKWRLELGRRVVYTPQNLGVLVVSRRGWRLELQGGDMEFGGKFGDGGGSSGSGDASEGSGGCGARGGCGGRVVTDRGGGGGENVEGDVQGDWDMGGGGGDGDGGGKGRGRGNVEQKRRQSGKRKKGARVGAGRTEAEVAAQKRYKEDRGYSNMLEAVWKVRGGAAASGSSSRTTRSHGGGSLVRGITQVQVEINTCTSWKWDSPDCCDILGLCKVDASNPKFGGSDATVSKLDGQNPEIISQEHVGHNSSFKLSFRN